ncbi:hypothetical protein VQ02_15280 [Methylobacterium variabile]|uniref:Peptidase S8/S53 domain-containing protein n=1 Tax=Methylobacterium variabile TaxID=298794 RepID=A0A0J6ST62_9HYPH|nr:S8 family serine peptidase [Methylobacterium variabile]KMO36538.1 hypothetical protein VQ02_15280 [Methylobacterium variabile]
MQQPEEDRTTSAASHADNAPANETRARVREAVERDWNDVREHPRREVSPVPAYLALAAAFALGFVLGRQFFLGAARPPRRGPRTDPGPATARVPATAAPRAPADIVPGRRYKLRFRGTEAMEAAFAAARPAGVATVSRRRAVASAVAMMGTAGYPTDLHAFRRRFDVEVVEDYQYQVELGGPMSADESAPDDGAGPSLDDVLEAIGARNAWTQTRGAGVALAVVDTGIDGTRAEFAAARRVGCWPADAGEAWVDPVGHGTMAACIAAASRKAGGAFDGVAPEAGLIACRTEFFDTELMDIYDYLADLAKGGMRIVASNSFGVEAGTPPDLVGQDFPYALADAVEAGVVAVFSAGNNHHLTGGDPDGDDPNSIWLYKSRADVLTVGACKLDGTMWHYSSRGPGQDHAGEGNARKPDVVAPTPENGRVLYGSATRALPNGWGTSGACAQGAGLAALLWSLKPNLGRDELFELIRSTAARLSAGPNAQGHGRIDCAAAVRAAARN